MTNDDAINIGISSKDKKDFVYLYSMFFLVEKS